MGRMEGGSKSGDHFWGLVCNLYGILEFGKHTCISWAMPLVLYAPKTSG